MSNVRKLGTADENFQSISIEHDMTKRERELNKEQVKQVKEKNEEHESGNYQYVVRGPPYHIHQFEVQPFQDYIYSVLGILQ
jgi:hypothetical protein